MDHWQSMLLFDMAFAERTLIDQGEVSPMATIHCPGNVVNLVSMNLTTDALKEKSLVMVHWLGVANEALAISMLSEMWMRRLNRYDRETEADYEARVHAVRPRDAEDRREVVMVQLYYRDDGGAVRELSQSREIIRDAAGKPTGLVPAEDDPSEVIFSEGRMTKVMSAKPPTGEQVRYAKQLLKRHGMVGTPLR